jgi:alpha-aminoadipic semialdehyde synthase
MHVGVAQHCLTHGKHLVTASYVSPEMKALDEK